MVDRLASAALLVAMVLGGCVVAQACNVPVFRYALERWHPDPYRVTVFHRGALTAAQRARVAAWEEASGRSQINLALQVIDVEAIEDEAARELFAAQSSPALPWLTVQYPQSLRNEKSVWAGPLSEEALTLLTASPLRSELIQRLAAGQTAVWLMLECGDADKDDSAAAQLNEELKHLAQKLTLPELTSAPEDNLLSDAPLKVAFSLLRVPRRSAAEKPFVELLLQSEPDLVEFAEPMVFPVFGRGRALLPLVGAGITADNIHESAAFLVGACSCEIKDLNPGFDLLLAADWDVLLFSEAPPTEIIATRKTAASGRPELVPIPTGAAPSPAPTPDVHAVAAKESTLEFHYVSIGFRGTAVLLALFALVVAAVILGWKRFA